MYLVSEEILEIPKFIRPICPIGPTLKKASSGIRSQDFAPNVLNTIRCAGSECGCHGGSLRQARAAQRHATAAEAINYAVAAADYYGRTIHPFQLLSFAILVV